MSKIRRDMLNGLFWNAIEKYSGLLVGIVISMILARILDPREYGIVAIATVIISFLQMFCTMGIGPAIIQHDDLSKTEIESIYTFSLIVGFFLAFLFFGASWVVADFYKNETLVPVCQILSLQLFFASANMVPNALMCKYKKFKEIARRTLFLQAASGVLSIIAAWYGAGVYALLLSPVITAIGIFFWNRFYFKLSLDRKFHLSPVKKIFSFSFFQLLFEIVNYFSRNLDKLIIGKCMSVDALGIYEKSYRLMQLPMNNVTSVINPVLQPVLKELQNDKKDLFSKYCKIVRYVAVLSFPLGFFLFGFAEESILFFYGEKWISAIPVFRILALSLPLQMILSTSGSIFLICNNTKMQFLVGIRNTMTTVVGFFVAALYFKTIESVAYAWTITLGINFFITYWIMCKKLFFCSFKRLIQELFRPAVIGCAEIAMIFIVDFFLKMDNLLLQILVKLIVAIITFLLFGHFFNIVDCKKLVAGLRGNF